MYENDTWAQTFYFFMLFHITTMYTNVLLSSLTFAPICILYKKIAKC